MSWKATIISALSKGDLELALQAAMKVNPRELLLLIENFPEDKNRTGIAVFLNKLGNLYWDAQMLLPAEKVFRKALKIWSLPIRTLISLSLKLLPYVHYGSPL